MEHNELKHIVQNLPNIESRKRTVAIQKVIVESETLKESR